MAAIATCSGAVALVDCGLTGVLQAEVVSGQSVSLGLERIEWDRFRRMRAVAQEVVRLNLEPGAIVLDVGGFDGSLCLFLPSEIVVRVVDPYTTGASGLALPLPDKSLDTVVSIDALEHVERQDRPTFLSELVRVCRKHLILNFPEQRSMDAQQVALQLTQNPFIGEHVNYGCPSSTETVEALKQLAQGPMTVQHSGHTPLNVWLPWYVLFQKDRAAGLAASDYLKSQPEETLNVAPFLYELIVCSFAVDLS